MAEQVVVPGANEKEVVGEAEAKIVQAGMDSHHIAGFLGATGMGGGEPIFQYLYV